MASNVHVPTSPIENALYLALSQSLELIGRSALSDTYKLVKSICQQLVGVGPCHLWDYTVKINLVTAISIMFYGLECIGSCLVHILGTTPIA